MSVSASFAEEAVLGGILLDNMRFHDIASIVGEDHFTSPIRKKLFAAIKSRVLAGEPADAVTIGEADADLFNDALDLASNTPSAAQVPAYANIVRNNWRRREVVQIALELSAGARAGEDDAVDSAIGRLLSLNSSVTDCEYTGKQAMKLAWDAISFANANSGKLPGIPTGLTELDDILGGWQNSDLTLIGGRPAMGKTAFIGGLVEAAAEHGFKPGFFSAEQPAVQMALRRVSLLSRVAASKLRNGSFDDEDWGMLSAGVKRANERDLMIYDRSAITLDELVGVSRKWVHSHGVKIIFIDYAQRITVPGADRIQEVASIARGLKNLARDLEVPVVALAQVVKGVDSRPTDKRPNAGDLANSDELTREADQILMLYRDEVYNPDSPDRGLAEILIEKNRHGPTGFKKVRFEAETMAFQPLSREREF
mgnify:FL=1